MTKRGIVFYGLLLSSSLCSIAIASTLEPDEDLVFFSQSAYLNKHGDTWKIPIHGWVFEPEKDSLWRKFTLAGLAEIFEIDGEIHSEKIFKERAWRFITDNKRNKEIAVQFGNGSVRHLNRSSANGHFESVLSFKTSVLGSGMSAPWVRFDVAMPEGDPRHFFGEVQLVPPKGCSVISDIDDTIKDSHVLNKHELLANTFLRPFKSVPGMAAAYKIWAKQGAVFYYVSGSPWQLYPPSSSFITDSGFPKGSYYMRSFRLKDSTFFNLFKSAEVFKTPTIEQILGHYPQRRFILVGDSGEKDPEVYGEMARRHPQQILAIFIRNITSERKKDKRFKAAFRSVSKARWHLFIQPDALKRFKLSGCY